MYIDPSKPSSIAHPKFFVHKQTAEALKEINAIIPETDLVSCLKSCVFNWHLEGRVRSSSAFLL